MKWNDPARDARLTMEEETRGREKAVRDDTPRKPWRDSVYGGLKGKVSVRTMDIIIWTLVAILVLVLIVGMVRGNG